VSAPAAAEILHRDTRVLAVQKPAGLTVIPARDEDPGRCLRATLEAALGLRLWVVHRLDRDTSGVVLFALDAAAHRALSVAFETRAVQKRYVALARGALPAADGVIDVALHTARKGKMRPAAPGEPEALPASTRYAVTRRARTLVGIVARVELAPATGRQHQLRVHLRYVGAPLVVDPLYGGCDRLASGGLGPGSPPLDRLALHAASITFPDPADPSHARTVTAPMPPDLAALDAWLAAQPE
jgi:RluA family pseudouridine synthase